MSIHQATNPFDLLGQTPQAVPPVKLARGSTPTLEIGWGEFRQGLLSSVGTILRGPRSEKDFLSGSFFKDSWIDRRFPRRAVIAAALWHIAFLIFPTPQFSAPRHNPALDNVELTWSGPIDDLPLVNLPAERPKPSPRGEETQAVPREGADAFHPRQRIFTDPAHPNHPRQTIINSAAPLKAPKLLPSLPNVVELSAVAAPARPHIQINTEALRQLRPIERQARAVNNEPAPTLQGAAAQPAELNLAIEPSNQPAKPKLDLNAAASPLAAKHAESVSSEGAPEINAAQSSTGAPSTFIAISAAPAPPAPVQPPEGNLAARVSISPEGKQRGVPGGSANGSADAMGAVGVDKSAAGGAKGGNDSGNPVGVSITGGNPRPGNSMSGLGGKPKLDLSASRPAPYPDTSREPEDPPPVRTAPPNFADLPPGARPEQIFGPKRVYTLHVNMPNLNSATGSWILNFSELGTNTPGPRLAANDIEGPEPVRKVDPKYPQTLIDEHVEGEVVLYAVIRRDGSVDGIQLVRGIDEHLDENAMHALSQWKFRPGNKQGEPVDVEAIVHIPFHAPTRR